MMSDKDLAGFTDEERAEIALILNDIYREGRSDRLDELYQADFWRRPPTIEEFLDDDYFLGSVCRPDPEVGQIGLIKELRDDLLEAFSEGRDSACGQLIMSGSIGGGKTFAGVIALLFRMAKSLCLRNPLAYYGLSPATTLNYYILSITREQVQDGAFGDCINMMRMSPFFIEACAEDLTKRDFKNQSVQFHGRVLLKAGSKARHAIGKNTIAAFCDEVNFRIEKDNQQAAKDVYDAITRRTRSRFGASADGLIVLISSSKNETSFLANHIRRNVGNPSVKIVARAFWEGMGKYKHNYSGEVFLVDPGSQFSQPRIIMSGERTDLLPADVQSRLLRVPIEHYSEFDSDLQGALCDIAGVSAANQLKFFHNHHHIINIIRDEVEDPFRGNLVIPMSIDDNHDISDYMDLDLLLRQTGSGYSPRRHPDNPRSLHIDMSSGAIDNLGVAAVHPAWIVDVETVDPMTQAVEMRLSPYYEIDFAFSIKRGHSGEPIDFGKIRRFLYWLRQSNFDISVSCDLQAMSQDMLNILKQNNFDAQYLSVDKTKAPYQTFRQIVAEGRLGGPDIPLLFFEMANLEDGSKMVDHPVRNTVQWGKKMLKELGSKDLADGLAGAVFRAESRKEAFKLSLHHVSESLHPFVPPQLRVRKSSIMCF